MNDCVFCKIVKGEIPAEKVYETEHVVAFLDIRPSVNGHTLVVPKQHFENILETPKEVLTDAFESLKTIAKSAMSAVGATSFNVGINTGRDAGQIIFHTHLHILPRVPDDGKKLWNPREISSEELAVLGERIRARLLER